MMLTCIISKLLTDTYPHLSNAILNPSVGHTLPREVQFGAWRNDIATVQKYAEYVSSRQISKYIDPSNGELVEWWMPKSIVPKRRKTAGEIMGQNVPERY